MVANMDMSERSETELNTALNTGSVSGMPGDFEGSVDLDLKQQTSGLFSEPNYQQPSVAEDEVETKRSNDILSPTSTTA